MKILFSIANLKVGGAQVVALRLAKKMNELGHEIHIYDHFPDYRDVPLIEANYSGAKIVSIQENFWIRTFIWKLNSLCQLLSPSFSLFDFLNEKRFKKVVRHGNYDVIHSHMYRSDQVVAKALNNNSAQKVVSSMHGCYEEQIAIHGWEKARPNFQYIFNRIRNIIYLTQKNIAFIDQLGLSNAMHLTRIYNGIDISILRDNIQAKPKEGPFVFGMIARGAAQKGWLEAIEAAVDLHDRQNLPIELHLIGGSDYLNGLKDSLADKRFIKFFGHQPETIRFMKNFDVGLLPSYSASESLPTSIIEYMALSIPTIASDIGEIPVMLTDQHDAMAGILIPLENGKVSASKLSKQMQLLMDSTELYQEFKNNCTVAVKKFDLDLIAKKHLALYAELL